MNFKDFVSDDKTSNAVVRKLEIIGEASKNTPNETRQKYKELPFLEYFSRKNRKV